MALLAVYRADRFTVNICCGNPSFCLAVSLGLNIACLRLACVHSPLPLLRHGVLLIVPATQYSLLLR